jgi:uncharacterized protein YecT (DUF1311 family)
MGCMKINKLILFTVMLLASVVSFSDESGPSFDCKLASTSIEISICENPALSAMDYQLGMKYREFRSNLNSKDNIIARKLQRHWVSNRNSQCNKSEGTVVVNCLIELYEQWLKWNEYGVLRVPLLLIDGKSISDIINPNIIFERTVKLKTERDTNGGLGTYEIALNVITDKKSEVVFKGLKVYPYKHKHYYEENNIDAVWYLMSNTGDVFKAYHHVYNDHGPQCVQEKTKTLNFWNDIDPLNDYGELKYYNASYVCNVYTHTFKSVKTSSKKLVFNYVYSGDPFSYNFKKNRYFTIDAEKGDAYWKAYFTDSKNNYYGEEYTNLFDRVGKDILNRFSYKPSDELECSIPKNPILYYELLKASIGSLEIPMSFSQMQYIANNVLTREHLAQAKQFKPLIEAVLKYLDDAKKVEGWKGKLQFAMDQYSLTSHYTEIDNPFSNNGFVSNPCFTKLRSPSRQMNAEQWIYSFWMRRDRQGNLEETEHILRLILKLI